MSAYKVFQAAPMDYHLEPGRYETMTFTKLLARYELVMNVDWVGNMQRSVDTVDVAATSNLLSVEDIRSNLCLAYYNSVAGGAGAFDGRHGKDDQNVGLNVQWKDTIDTILRLTAWANVSDTAGVMTRMVDQSKVNSELAYSANITLSGADAGDDTPFTAAADDGGRVIAGLAADSGSVQYDHEAIGQLINNTNMREVLNKMRNHGCFIHDDDKTASVGNEGVNGDGDPALNFFVVNPRVQEYSVGADNTSGVRTLLDKDDELIFPVNLKSIIGHTNTGADEDIDAGASLEINLTFKQSKQLDSSPSHADNTTTEQA